MTAPSITSFCPAQSNWTRAKLRLVAAFAFSQAVLSILLYLQGCVFFLTGTSSPFFIAIGVLFVGILFGSAGHVEEHDLRKDWDIVRQVIIYYNPVILPFTVLFGILRLGRMTLDYYFSDIFRLD